MILICSFYFIFLLLQMVLCMVQLMSLDANMKKKTIVFFCLTESQLTESLLFDFKIKRLSSLVVN